MHGCDEDEPNSAATPQPPPVRNDSTPIVDLVVKDLQARAEAGLAKYGVKLQAHNGRDALMDAYQEALDMGMYLRQKLEEHSAERAAVRDQVERVVGEEIIAWHAANHRAYVIVMPHNIARRVADRLCVPVLSDKDAEELIKAAAYIRERCDGEGAACSCAGWVALMERIAAAGGGRG